MQKIKQTSTRSFRAISQDSLEQRDKETESAAAFIIISPNLSKMLKMLEEKFPLLTLSEYVYVPSEETGK